MLDRRLCAVRVTDFRIYYMGQLVRVRGQTHPGRTVGLSPPAPRWGNWPELLWRVWFCSMCKRSDSCGTERQRIINIRSDTYTLISVTYQPRGRPIYRADIWHFLIYRHRPISVFCSADLKSGTSAGSPVLLVRWNLRFSKLLEDSTVLGDGDKT